MKRKWLVTLLAVVVFGGLAPAAFAAKASPSVVGDWLAEGITTANMCVEKYGCERAVEPFSGTVSFYGDHNLALDAEVVGLWSQVKNKVVADLNAAEIESMLNEILYEELGTGVYLDITGLSFKAKISKDGNQLPNGKLYMKFEFTFEYLGEIYNGKGSIAIKFTGTRAVNNMYNMATDGSEEQEATPAIIRLIGIHFVDNLRSKFGR